MNNKKDYFSQVFEDYAIVSTGNQIKANESLGVTQEYSSETRKKLFDDINQRTAYKNEVFGDKKTRIDITGEIIHQDSKAAMRKYKRESTSTKWAKHASETDHIVSLKRGHSRLKSNPFLSDEDVKRILNDKRYTYREVSKRFNTSKGDNSDFTQFNSLSIEGKGKVIHENIKAETGILAKTTFLTATNVGNEFGQGARSSLEASAIPVMVEGVHNLFLVANGDKKFDEAIKDMGKLTTKIAVAGGGMKVVTTGISKTLTNSSSEILKKIGSSNQVGQIISVALILTDSIGKYVNGEINGEQFFNEIGEKGVGLVSGVIGAAVGTAIGETVGAAIGQTLIPIPVVGALIGSLIISTACMAIYKAYRSVNIHKEKLSKVSQISSQALGEMGRQRNILKEMMNEQFSKWDEQFNLGFEEIFDATLSNDVNGISGGLERILTVFNESVKFKTFEEFNQFFMDENATLLL